MFIVRKLNREVQLLISSFTFLYYCSIRWVIDNLFLCIDVLQPFIFSLKLYPVIILIQINKFKMEIKDVKSIIIRLVFSYFLSLLFPLLIINSVQLSSYFFSKKVNIQDYKIPIIEIEGLNGRKRVHFYFNKKEQLKKISDYKAQMIMDNGISMYCVQIKAYKGMFGYTIIDQYDVKYCY